MLGIWRRTSPTPRAWRRHSRGRVPPKTDGKVDLRTSAFCLASDGVGESLGVVGAQLKVEPPNLPIDPHGGHLGETGGCLRPCSPLRVRSSGSGPHLAPSRSSVSHGVSPRSTLGGTEDLTAPQTPRERQPIPPQQLEDSSQPGILTGWAAFFAATALARPTVVQLAAPVDLDLPGRHARPFVDGGGEWRIGFGRSGSFHSVPWTGAGVDLDAQITHVMLGDGVDHGWVRCPDGGFLHVASVNRAALDDSAIASRLNAALTLIAQRAVVTESEALATNDMAVVCGAGFEGVAFAERGLEGEDEADQDFLYALDARFFAGETPMVYDLSASTRVTGNSLVWDDARDRLLSFGLERDLGMRVVSWGPDLQHQDSTDVEGPEPPLGMVGAGCRADRRSLARGPHARGPQRNGASTPAT